MENLTQIEYVVPSALMLLVRWWEGHPACATNPYILGL